jgi:uncharacterized OsmC-like protein
MHIGGQLGRWLSGHMGRVRERVRAGAALGMCLACAVPLMRLIASSEDSIRLVPGGAGLVVESEEGVVLSPFHLLAASLAWCTWSVLAGWSGRARMSADELEVEVRWEFGGDPVRVAAMALDVVWPGLPAARLEAARRAAGHCTVHQTLEVGSALTTRVLPGRPGP